MMFMKFNIHGKKVEITESIKEYIEEKVSKLDKYLSNPEEITAKVVVRISEVFRLQLHIIFAGICSGY